MGKYFLYISFGVVFSLTTELTGQNTGLGTYEPTHTLHVVPSTGPGVKDPVRIDSLQLYELESDTTLLAVDPALGVIRYMPLSMLKGGLENWVYDDTENYIIQKRALLKGSILVFTDKGRIGIGNTDPSHPLHIVSENSPLRLEGLNESFDDSNRVIVADEEGVLYAVPQDSLGIGQGESLWTSSDIEGRDGIYVTEAAEQGDTVMISSKGRLRLGSLSFSDEAKAIHVLPAYSDRFPNGGSPSSEIGIEYNNKLSGSMLKADGGIELYRSKEAINSVVNGYIDFHRVREEDYDIRLQGDATHQLSLLKSSLDQSLYLNDKVNPRETYIGGNFLLETQNLSDSITYLTGIRAVSIRDGDGTTQYLEGGNLQAREEANHQGSVTYLRGLKAGIEKNGSGENSLIAEGVNAYIHTGKSASGSFANPTALYAHVSLQSGSRVEVKGDLSGIISQVDINAENGSPPIANLIGMQSRLISDQDEGNHQTVENAEMLRLEHNENFSTQNSLYGLRIMDVSGSAQNNYSIYTDDGKVRFGDVIQQGSSYAEDNLAVSLGLGDSVLGDRSMAIGLGNFIGSDASESFISGKENSLSDNAGASNIIMGENNTIVEGNMSFAGGWQSYLSGNQSFSFGYNDTLIGNSSVTFGTDNVIKGENAAAIGSANYVTDEGIALGKGNTVTALEGAFSTGFNNEVNTPASFAAGKENKVGGESWNTAFGFQNSIGGSYTRASLVSGYENYVSSSYSLVVGNQDTLSGEGSAVFGKHNVVDGTTSLVAGTNNFLNGTGSTSSNLLVGTDNELGDGVAAVWESVILGKSNKLIGSRSFIFGEGNTMKSDYGISLGLNNTVSGSRGMALGTEVTANTDELVLGFRNGLFLKNGNTYVAKAPAGHAGLIALADELFAIDGKGNKTLISPHNFSLIPEGPSEELAWAYFSLKNGKAVNVDMARVIRLVEQLSGETLIFQSEEGLPPQKNTAKTKVEKEIEALRAENQELKSQLENVNYLLNKLQQQVEELQNP
ncbi:MAG: hypothetical protein AAGC85_21335 [Bacteroidota bacterium]